MLRIAVIGLGSMGKNHTRVCSELENVELVGISDIDKATAKNVAKKFNTKAFYDYKGIINRVDAAIIATPTSTHYNIAADLLNNGKHILIEKPICDSIKKAKEIVEKAEKENLVLAVGHIERHNPAVKFVKDALDKKRFGKLIAITSKRVSNLPNRIKDVGVIFDFGVHDIDVMRFLVGEISSVYATGGKFNENIDYEDHAVITLNFENRINGVVEVNWLTPMKIRKLFLTCSRNYVEIDYINQFVTILSSTFGEIDETDLFHTPIKYNINQIALEKREPLKNEIEDFINAVRYNKKPLVTGKDGLIALKIAQASVESYKKGKVVKI